MKGRDALDGIRGDREIRLPDPAHDGQADGWLVGLGVAVWLSLRGLERQGLGRKPALDALAWGLPTGVLVGHLVHVLGWWDYYLTNSSAIWQLNIDSLSLWGGCRLRRVSRARPRWTTEYHV